MGFGFEYSDIPRAQYAYRALMIEASSRFGMALKETGNSTGGLYWSHLAHKYVTELRGEGGKDGWWSLAGMHGAADAVKAGFLNETESAGIVASWFNDPLQLASLSPFESYFILKALTALNATEQALYLMRRQWGGMIASGATTTWERFDPQFADAGALPEGSDDPPVNSMNDLTSMAHPWSSGATSILTEHGLGIRATSPGYATWEASPDFMWPTKQKSVGDNRLSWVSGIVPSPHGQIEFGLSMDTARASVVVPKGTRGVVGIPGVVDLGIRRISVFKIQTRLAGSIHEGLTVSCKSLADLSVAELFGEWRNETETFDGNTTSFQALSLVEESSPRHVLISALPEGMYEICFQA